MTTQQLPTPEATRAVACDDVLNRLRRAQGQLRAVVSMIEAGEDCERVVTQMAAAKSALDRAAVLFVLKLSNEESRSFELDAEDLEKMALRLA